jgi:hypothetical protein
MGCTKVVVRAQDSNASLSRISSNKVLLYYVYIFRIVRD